MTSLNTITEALLHLIFPHVCEGCGNELPNSKHLMCIRCLASLPATNFHFYPNNPVEKIFWGRIPVTHATSQYYFTKESIIQHLMHQFKYHGNRELGFYLGQLMGYGFMECNRFSQVHGLIPLPLFESKERKRGFNQAAVLCEGISDVMGIPVFNDLVKRSMDTESQTRKGRVERWQNMDGRFFVQHANQVYGRHLLLVDDVITTGATLEACGSELLKINQTRLSIATLCFSAGF